MIYLRIGIRLYFTRSSQWMVEIYIILDLNVRKRKALGRNKSQRRNELKLKQLRILRKFHMFHLSGYEV